MVYYYTYKTTNLINGKFYIGKHQTDDLNDDYMGSGNLLKRAIKKYGQKNFQTEIIEVYDTEWKMNVAEKILVVPDIETNYNLNQGGNGGFSFINSNQFLKEKAQIKAKEAVAKIDRTNWINPLKGKKRPTHSEFMKSIGFGKTKTPEQIRKHKEAWLETTKDNPIRAKEWTINGIQIKNLKKYCRDNNINYYTFRKQLLEVA